MNKFHAGTKIKTILSGTLLAQVIPFLVLPLLSRLFSPEEFGYFSLYFVWTLILGNCFAYRYEMSIVVAKTEKNALELSQLCVFNTFFSFLVFSLIALSLNFLSNIKILNGFDIVLSLSIIASGTSLALSNIYMSLKNRSGQYGAMSLVMVFQQVLVSLFKVILGALSIVTVGLYLGHTAGLILVGLYCLFRLVSTMNFSNLISKSKYLALTKRYKKFPIFNLPLTILTSFSNGFLITILFWFEMIIAAGLVGLSRTLINAPVGILTRSIGKVFFELAAKGINEHHDDVQRFVTKTMFMIIRVALLPAIFVAFYAEECLTFLLGESWIGVGPYAAFLVPIAFMLLLTAWPERIFEVCNKQEVILKYQVILDSLTVLLLIIISYLFRDPLVTTGSYSVMAIFYNIGYLYLVFKTGKFSLTTFFKILKTTILFSVVHILVLFVIGEIFINKVLAIGVSLGYVITVLLVNFRVLKSNLTLPRGSL